MVQNKGLIFKAVPDGWPQIGKDLAVETREFDKDAPPPPGGITTQNFYVSFDPYQRGRMRAPEAKSYSPPFTLGQPFDNRGIGRVLKSDHPDFKPGDLVSAVVGLEEYSALTKEKLDATAPRKVDNTLGLELPVYLGALGMPGLTAYSSFYDIGKPKKGETIFISSAAGAVGTLVGQLAKHEGLTVIGSVGDDDKLKFIKECGFDDGFNYKKEKPADALKRLCPNGIDIYYENVGGEHLEAALDNMNPFGRIGKRISAYDTWLTPSSGMRDDLAILGQAP
jgi:NADPH-dependent curcumin reductase CurA